MPSTQNRLWGRKWKRVKAYKPVTYFDEFPCIRYPADNQFVENARDPHFGNFKVWPNDNGIIYLSTMFARNSPVLGAHSSRAALSDIVGLLKKGVRHERSA
jgi:hypothetical protein